MLGSMRSLAVVVTASFLIIGGFSSAGAEPGSTGPQPSATGAQPSASPTATPKMLDTVVVTAERHPTTLGASPREVYVVDAATMARSGAQTIADALRFVPGVVVQSYGVAGDLQDVMLRGASAEQTLVLLDGRPVNEPDTGVADFSDLPLDGVDRIEVVEGGASALYGSGAVGGVINIVTKSAASDEAYEGIGYAGAAFSGLTISAGAAQLVRVRASTRHSRAQNVFDYPAFLDAPAGTRTNNDTDLYDTNATLTRALGRATVTVRFDDNASNIGAAGDLEFGASGLARQQRYVNRGAVSISVPDARGAWNIDAFADDRRLHFFDPTTPFAFDDLTHATTRGLSVRTTRLVGSSNTVTIGYDSRGDRAMFQSTCEFCGPTVIASDATTAWYVHDEYSVPDSPFLMTAGIRSEHTQGTKPSLVPAFGAQLRFPDGVLLKATYGRAFRIPTLDERYFPGFSNPLLEPEYSSSGDIGIVKQFAGGIAAFTVFGSDTENLIVFNDLGVPFNVSRSMVRGTNLDVRSALGTGTAVHAAYTDYLVASDRTLLTRLLYRPFATASAEVWHATRVDEYGGGLYYVGSRFADEANTQLLSGYAALSLHYTREIGRHWAITVRADNMLRGQAEDELGYPVNRPTLSLRVDAHQ